MGDQYCPAGKIECELFYFDKYGVVEGDYLCDNNRCTWDDDSISDYEQCPWPSRQRIDQTLVNKKLNFGTVPVE